MWNPGDVITWRGIFRERVWHAQPVIVVKDSQDETVVALLPGTECMAPEGYLQGKQSDKRRWNFKDKYWELEKYDWHTNRLLILLRPNQFYSTMYFWDHESNQFLCYYINFQIPFHRSASGIDTLDLDLDLIINPDFSFEWKDEEDYQKAIEHEIISSEWVQGIENAMGDIFNELEKRQYPFDGSWLDWTPDSLWTPPKLPENWDRV
jgi:predicted RNA-binding protein associated with RNAse of E/G family